jgi:hypothetical protein
MLLPDAFDGNFLEAFTRQRIALKRLRKAEARARAEGTSVEAWGGRFEGGFIVLMKTGETIAGWLRLSGMSGIRVCAIDPEDTKAIWKRLHEAQLPKARA